MSTLLPEEKSSADSLVDALAAEQASKPCPADPRGELYRLALQLRDLGAKPTQGVQALHRVNQAWSADVEVGELLRMMKFVGLPSDSNAEGAPAAAITLRYHADRERDRRAPTPMVVDGLLPEGGIGAIIALPGVGKTLCGIELARCIASGEPFAGKAVASGVVVYACPDAPASTERRLLAMPDEAAARVVSITDLPLLPGGLPDLRAAVEQVAAAGEQVRLVVLDTYDAAREHSSGGHADQDGGAEAMMRGLRSMASDLKLAVVIIHHATRQDAGRARGTVVFDARCDWMAVVEPAIDGLMMRTTKARDGERGPVGAWTIVPVLVAERAVPTLRWQGASGTAPEATDARAEQDRRVLAAASENSVSSIRDLVRFTGLKSTATVSRVVDRLRSKGLMQADRYQPTAIGLDWLDGVPMGRGMTPLEQGLEHPVPPETDEWNTTVKTECSSGTAKGNNPQVFQRFPVYRDRERGTGNGTGRAEKIAAEPHDGEDSFSPTPGRKRVRMGS